MPWEGFCHDGAGEIPGLPSADAPAEGGDSRGAGGPAQAGKGKTVQFRELLSEKLVVEMVLTQLRYAGLE